MGFCASCFVRSPRPFPRRASPSPPPPVPSPSGAPRAPRLTPSTKSIARARAGPLPPPRAAPRFSFRDNGDSLWPNQPPEGPGGRERFPPRPSVKMKAGLGRGLGPQHSKAPPGIRPFKASFGGLVTLFLKLFVFLKWPLRRERGLRQRERQGGGRPGGGGETLGASLPLLGPADQFPKGLPGPYFLLPWDRRGPYPH